MAIEWILQHGWGWDRHCWDEWQKYSTPDLTFKTLDRGYFGESSTVSFSPHGGIKGIISHSFGLHLIPSELFFQADILIILAGFQWLSLDDKMEGQLAQDPQRTLRKFYSLCFYPGKRSINFDKAHINQILHKDLKDMKSSILNLTPLKRIPKVIIFHGSEDKVAPIQSSYELHEQLPNSSHQVLTGAPHALHITHAKPSLDFIMQEVSA